MDSACSNNHLSNKREIKAVLINARSLRNKFSDLEELAFTENYDVIGITESWLNTEQRDFLAEYDLPGYHVFSSERSNRAGGGVLLYIKFGFHPVVISKPSIDNTDCIFLQLRNDSHEKLTLALIYRPPAQLRNVDDQIYNQIAEISCTQNTVIFGDFNLPVPKWGEALTSHTGLDLYTNLQESSLHQFVNNPTRGTNILDLVFATSENLVSNVTVGEEFSTSDHRIVAFKLKFNEDEVRASNEKVPNFKYANFIKLRSLLASSNWKPLTESDDINDAWKIFTKTLNDAVNICVPLRSRRPTKNIKPKWWNTNIKHCLAAKKNAHKKYVDTRNESDKIRYDALRREAKKLIKQSKKTIEAHIASISKTNPKEFFSYIRSKKVSTSTIGPLIAESGEHTDSETEMARLLNTYFASVFTVEDTNTIPALPPYTLEENSKIHNISVNEQDVQFAINKLKSNKTPGPDKISPRILKETLNEISKPLSDLFNLSLKTCKVPQEWKFANVTPIFKKGSKDQPENYRPISLTSVVCKLLENILRDKIVKYLEKNKLISDTQHGFRNKRSCLTNLLDFFYDIMNIYDETKSVDIVYLDFQKAFDKVPHKRLLAKLKAHGFSGNVLRWIDDWLTGRKQRVVINGKESDWINVTSGVPQGSVLGPILFLIYINDIDEGLVCRLSKFADDTKIGNSAATPLQRQTIQSDLDKLFHWSQEWQMDFNVNKCKVLNIGSKNIKSSYTMNNIQLENVSNEKDLGIIITNDLKPTKQCTEAVKKANKLIGFIGRAFEYKTEKTVLTLYNSLVRPQLEYCVQFWSPYYKKDMEKLERVQRRVTKMIPRLRNKSYEERLAELNLFTLTKRRLRGDLIQVYKIFRGHDNLNVEKYFTIDQLNYTRGNGHKIKGKRFQSHEAKHFFFNRVVNVWNKLPSSVVNCDTVLTFKSRLDKFLASNPQLSMFTSE